MLSEEDYQRTEVSLDNKPFLYPVDAEDIKASIHYVRWKFMKFCCYRKLGDWRTAILKENCGKGRIMSFLHWICAEYFAKRQKKEKKRSLYIYWRDFKMLYRRVNGEYVNANNRHEVVKYIDGTLVVDFELDTTSKNKPVAGPDDLLLLLGKSSENPLGERKETDKSAYPRKAAHYDCGDNSDADADNEPEYDDDSDAGDDPGSDDDVLSDSEDDGSDDSAANEDMDECGGSDNGYNSDGTNVTMTEDTDKCYMTELDECG
ncbi:uncharacterized protein PAC_15794 [Phialocephala subalpina]|uniref:Uncharacterized protein n=1 Tax=Phialocephala subalpina TaxID=576137 RepID=A0A1L7XLK8_9HELO|nr:uncharacterized protein PAC_15794 [Phialocephala subalpina]